jgi:hypothetical protein
MADILTSFMNWADKSEYGDGYSVLLTLADGRRLDVSPHRPKDGVVHCEVIAEYHGAQPICMSRKVMFIALDKIISVEIAE